MPRPERRGPPDRCVTRRPAITIAPRHANTSPCGDTKCGGRPRRLAPSITNGTGIDFALIERVLAGDRSAFNDLVLRHRDSVKRLVFRYVKRDEDADDVTQRALLQAYENLGSFRRESSFKTWLSRIAVHLALNHLRGTPKTDPLEALDDVPAFTNALETSRLAAAEVWAKVSVRLSAELPPKQRLVVELRLFHELSFREESASSPTRARRAPR